MNADTVNATTLVKNQQREYWEMNLKYILDKSKQQIDVNKYKQPNSTISTTFLNTPGEENSYFWFVYVPQKIFHQTQVQVSGSIKA